MGLVNKHCFAVQVQSIIFMEKTVQMFLLFFFEGGMTVF